MSPGGRLSSHCGQHCRQQPRRTTSETLATMEPKAGVRGKALALKSLRQETELQRSQTK